MSRELHRFREMDVDVAVYGADARRVAAVERLFAEWDRVFSRFRPHSELALVNASRAPVVVVSAGGDVAVRGGAVVGLPRGGSVRVESRGVATSGITHRQWLRGGAVQHHLVDPRTGRPAVSRWSEVTVVGPTCLAADVAAKAAFLLSDDGPDWLDEHGLAGRFLTHDVAVTNGVWRDCLPEAA